MQQEGIPVNHMTTKLDKTLSQKRCRLSLQLFLTVRLQGFINFSGLHAPIFLHQRYTTLFESAAQVE